MRTFVFGTAILGVGLLALSACQKMDKGTSANPAMEYGPVPRIEMPKPDDPDVFDLAEATEGTYLLLRVRAWRSELSPPTCNASMRVEHEFSQPGVPRTGDKVNVAPAFTWCDRNASILMKVQLPAGIESKAGSVAFLPMVPYENRVFTDKRFEWRGNSALATKDGFAVASVFKKENRKGSRYEWNEPLKLKRSELVAKREGRDILIYGLIYEMTDSDSMTAVELLYRKY